MTKQEIVAQIASGKLKPEDAIKLLNAMDAASAVRNITFKVSEKGGVSVYGLNSRMPVTLYKSQWVRLFGEIDRLKAFIDANDKSLSQSKSDKKAAA